jgi:hypothetical protein
MKKYLLLFALLALTFGNACQRDAKIKDNGENAIDQKGKGPENEDFQLGFQLIREEDNGVTITFQEDFSTLKNYIYTYEGNYEFSYEYDKESRIFSCRFVNPNTKILFIDLDNREVLKSYMADDNPCEYLCCECPSPESDEYVCEGCLTPHYGDNPGWSCTCENIMDCSDCQPCVVTVTDRPGHYLFVDAEYVVFRDE